MTDTQSVKPCCHSHPQELAVAICFEEKLFLCPDCLVEDRHLSKGVVTLKKLNGFLQEKKQTLIQHQERIENGLVSDTQAKEITKAVLARIEPIVHEIVMTELKGSKAEPKDIKELLKKVDNLIMSNQATGSVEVVAEMENEIKKLESTGSQPLVDKNINTIAKRVSGLLQGTSCEEPVRQERSRKTSFDVGLHFGEFIQLPEKESYTGLEITFGKRSDQIPSFCSELKKFKRLSDLQLDFCFCTSMNDEKLTELSSTLKSMNSLTKLQIKFWDTTALSDVGIKELSSALKSLTSLTELQLQFSCCSLISNAGLKDLSLALTKLSSLTSLQLNFISCGLISDAGLKEVSSALKRISSLKKLNLDFSSCGIIRDDDVKELIVSIKSVDTLTHLQLDFSGIDSLSGEGKSELDLLLTNYKKI